MNEAFLDFFAGTIAGAVSTIVSHPLDTIRVRLQTNLAVKNSLNRIFSIKKEGFLKLYRGLLPPLSTIAFQNAIIFGTYGPSLRWLEGKKNNKNRQTSLLNIYFSGTLAGGVQTFITTPVELVKIRLQIKGSKYKNTWECTKKICKTEGIKGLNRGFVITFIRDFFSYGIYFSSYEISKRYLMKKSTMSPSFLMFLSGGLAGMIAWLAVYPTEVIKSRIQAYGETAPSWWTCAKQMYQKEGIKCFIKGLDFTMYRAFFFNGTTFLVYEFVLESFRQLN